MTETTDLLAALARASDAKFEEAAQANEILAQAITAVAQKRAADDIAARLAAVAARVQDYATKRNLPLNMAGEHNWPPSTRTHLLHAMYFMNKFLVNAGTGDVAAHLQGMVDSLGSVCKSLGTSLPAELAKRQP